LRKGKEEIIGESQRLKTVVKEVITAVIEDMYTEDQPIVVGLTKVNEVVQELCVKITDLEARVVLTTPPEELARRE